MSEHTELRDSLTQMLAMMVEHIFETTKICGGNVIHVTDREGIEYSVTVCIRRGQKAKLDTLTEEGSDG